MRFNRILAAAAALVGDATAISFLRRKSLKREPIIGNAYADPMSACCACFKTKYAWPENSGMPATSANKHTCNTCYVADRYGIEPNLKGTVSIPQSTCPAPAGGLSSVPLPTYTGTCQNYCDIAQPGAQCQFELYEPDTGNFIETKKYAGAGACANAIADNKKIIAMDPTGELKHVCEVSLFQIACPTECKTFGCGADAAGGDSGNAGMQKAVHEWNWNCADGNAPAAGQAWMSGPVDGEPAARSAYLMCSEEHEWYCHNEDQDDIKKSPDMDMPEHLSASTCDVSYMSLLRIPNVDFSTVR